MRDFYQHHKKQITIWFLAFMLFMTGMIYLHLLSALHNAWTLNDHALTAVRRQISDRGRQKVAYDYCGSTQNNSKLALFLPWELQKLVRETASKVELCQEIILQIDSHS